MDTQNLSLIAGAVSSLIFVSSHVPMLWKAYKTRDLSSYSLLNIILINVGNLLYWLYIVSLPIGPVWMMHTFYTVSSGLLLYLYGRYVLSKSIKRYSQRLLARLRSKISLPSVPSLNHHHDHQYSSCQS
jgi:uncharacterized protein with PQ loop repeat